MTHNTGSKTTNVYHLFVMYADDAYTAWSFDVLAVDAQGVFLLLDTRLPVNHLEITLLRKNVATVPDDFVSLSMANLTLSQAIAWANK